MNAQAITVAADAEVPAAMSETAAILSMIERAARDPAVDMDKFERLMGWKERIENRAAEERFNAAMSAAQKEMPQVARDRTNDHTRSRYATLEAIAAAIAPIYTKHGFSLSFGCEQSTLPGHYRITCVASNAGHSRSYAADLPADAAGSQGKVNKTPIQAFGSTMSYGRRYLICLIFNVAIKDEDDDGGAANAAETITEEQAQNLHNIIEEAHADVRRFCQYFKVSCLADLPAGRYEEAIGMLQQKRGGR